MNERTRITVVIVDDHSVLRYGVKMTLSQSDRVELVGEASDTDETLKLVKEHHPDVVLLDVMLVSGDSLSVIPQIVENSPSTRVLILTGVMDEAVHKRAILLGAKGILLKHNSSEVLVPAIRKVHAGEAWIDRQLTAKVLEEAVKKESESASAARRFAALTDRELDIVRLLADGHNNHSIAANLNMSEKTVRNRLTVIYDKLEVSSRLELAILISHENLDLS